MLGFYSVQPITKITKIFYELYLLSDKCEDAEFTVVSFTQHHFKKSKDIKHCCLNDNHCNFLHHFLALLYRVLIEDEYDIATENVE